MSPTLLLREYQILASVHFLPHRGKIRRRVAAMTVALVDQGFMREVGHSQAKNK